MTHWIKDQITTATGPDDNNADVYVTGVAAAATLATILALWSIGM
jgi:hypothetical protein